MTLTPSRYDVLKKGDIAPEFNLPGTDGENHSLGKHSGKKAYLIIFMCNHCPYVVPKFRYLKELFDNYEDKGLIVIGINSNDTDSYGEDDFEHMKQYSKEEGFRFPYVLDETQEIAKKYGAACTPDPFLFDKDLKLVYHGRIDDAHQETHEEAKTNELEEAIQQVLEGKEVTIKEEPSLGCNVKWKN
tara:strand:+ start:23043 stop:23603 length:561 start_codon:yes stop_codon:yes gene_type:complete